MPAGAEWRHDRAHHFHRYVIDANRDPSGASLYPGQNTTGLVPADRFRR
jgi:N-formylglutamate amidohydrolase